MDARNRNAENTEWLRMRDMAETETDADYIMDFALALGEQLIICGGELWRAEEILHTVFQVYEMEDASVMILPNLLIISARKAGHKVVTRQRNIGEVSVNLEKLTRLKRLVHELCEKPEEPEKLMGLFRQAADVPPYSFGISLAGLLCAILSLVYLFHGSLAEAGIVLLCIVGVHGIKAVSGQIQNVNHMAVNAAAAFLAGSAALFAGMAGAAVDPYLIMIVSAFAMLPGIPLINSARELLYGRVMSGSLMLLQAFLETVFIVAGFYLAITLFGR